MAKEFGHIMIDLETLSTHNDAAIIEIGAVEFNKFTGDVGETFNVLIEPSDWCKNNRHVDGETIKWWFQQSDEARKRFTTHQSDTEYATLKDALLKLKFFIECRGKYVVVWGNGATMDISILENAYNYFDIPVPWNYRNVNDVRTIVDLKPSVKYSLKWSGGVKHSAVADCLHQIQYTVETLKQLGYGK